MFGVVAPCRHSLADPALRAEWLGHLCGGCLALRDGGGQSYRALTNTDAVALEDYVGLPLLDAPHTGLAIPSSRNKELAAGGDVQGADIV